MSASPPPPRPHLLCPKLRARLTRVDAVGDLTFFLIVVTYSACPPTPWCWCRPRRRGARPVRRRAARQRPGAAVDPGPLRWRRRRGSGALLPCAGAGRQGRTTEPLPSPHPWSPRPCSAVLRSGAGSTGVRAGFLPRLCDRAPLRLARMRGPQLLTATAQRGSAGGDSDVATRKRAGGGS